jgi:hypothetical protein
MIKNRQGDMGKGAMVDFVVDLSRGFANPKRLYML